MAYLVKRRAGGWEIRESRHTPRGPRSRTLASFRVLDDEALDRADRRSARGLDRDRLRGAALRVGAPLPRPKADSAARCLLGEAARGRPPRPALRDLLTDALADGPAEVSDTARSAAVWVDSSLEERGAALLDLLLLADRLPSARSGDLRFPPLG